MKAAKSFFSDVPWGSIPLHRRSEMVHVSILPRMGLLGGSSKPSKLAALAASRKKQNEDKKKNDQKSQAPEAGRAVSLLDRLAAKKDPEALSSNISAPSGTSEKLRFTASFRNKGPVAPEPVESDDELEETVEESTLEAPLPVFKAEPSVFAKALCGVNESDSDGAMLSTDEAKGSSKPQFGLPYTTNQTYMNADPFAKPSPDDAILAAQSKGSLHY
jgi:elongation factor 1 alpha-like protein